MLRGAMQVSIADHQSVEFVMNEAGNAILFHKGPLPDNYIWAQYEPDGHAMQFITEEGDTHVLGMKIHPPFRAPLSKTDEVFLIEVDEQKKLVSTQLIKFTGMAEGG